MEKTKSDQTEGNLTLKIPSKLKAKTSINVIESQEAQQDDLTIKKKISSSQQILETQQKSRKKHMPNCSFKQIGLIQNIRDKIKAPLFRVCLTGGPCAGKSSCMKYVQTELSKKGFIVYIVPEIPTITAEGGGMIQMSKMSEQQIIDFQANLIQFQKAAEDYFLRIALMQDQPAVVLCDRGTCDPRAYVSEEQWQVIMDQEGWNTNTLRDFRYDAVVHLVTAAFGAEKFYGHDNKARYEVTQLICSSNFKNIEQAREADKKVLNAYVGHPHHLIIDNMKEPKTFKHKLERVTTQLSKIVGLDYDLSFNKSFLLNNCFPFIHILFTSIKSFRMLFTFTIQLSIHLCNFIKQAILFLNMTLIKTFFQVILLHCFFKASNLIIQTFLKLLQF